MKSTTKTTASQKKAKKERLTFIQSNWRFLVGVAVIISVGTFLIFVGSNRTNNTYIDTHDRATSVIENVGITGRELGAGVADLGCNSNSSAGLSRRISCDLVGYKYVETAGDVKSTMYAADESIRSAGFNRTTDSDFTQRVLDGDSESSVSYIKDHTNIQLSWSTYPWGQFGPGSAISEGLREHWLTTPSNGANVVAMTVRETYWSCTAGNFDLFGWSCAFPPRTLN